MPSSRSRSASSSDARNAPVAAAPDTAETVLTDSYCLSASTRQSKQPARRLASAFASVSRAAIAGSGVAIFCGPQAAARARLRMARRRILTLDTGSLNPASPDPAPDLKVGPTTGIAGDLLDVESPHPARQ